MKNKQKLLDLLEIRNHSILAHGYNPITQSDWNAMHDFAESRLLPFMVEEFGAVGVKNVPRQLPTQWK